MEVGVAAHSIYFDVLSEHGWVGLALFLMIGVYSWMNCSWLIRRSRGRPELAWATVLGKMGQAVLVGFWVGGAFQSLAYFDEYWCLLFSFDAAFDRDRDGEKSNPRPQRLRRSPFSRARKVRRDKSQRRSAITE